MPALRGLPPNTEARRALVSVLLRRRDIKVADFVYYAVEDLRESVPIESERVANRAALRMPEGHPYHIVLDYWKDEVRHFDGAAPTVVLLDDPRLPPGHQGWAYVWSGGAGTLISFNERTP